jgi:hypothetical protein
MLIKILLGIKKALLPILGVLAALVFVGIVFPVKTEALLGVDVSQAIIGAIGDLGGMIMQMLGSLLGILIELVVKIFSYSNFVNMKAPPAVHIGWTIIRDFSNMMFIVILIVIAFGTIMKMQQYHARSLLTKMIIMIVLINFSKTITGIFVDFSQVIMLTFVNSFRDSAPIVLTVGLNLAQMTSFAQNTDGLKGFGSVVVAIFLANGMLVVAIAVILAMLVILVARILMIWILVILSPIAYIASVLPNTSRYASRWWTELGKNLSAGPVLAFFLWLSLSVISTSAGAPIDISDIGGVEGNLNEAVGGIDDADLPKGATEIMTTQNMFNYIITIALLLTGIMLTQEFGVMGGSAVGRFPDKLKSMGIKGLKKPFNNRFAKRTYGAVGRKITEKAPILSPSYWKGMGMRGERLAKQQSREIEGKGEEAAEKILDEWLPRITGRKRGNLKLSAKGAAMPRTEMARSAVVGEYESEMMKEISESGAGYDKMAELAERAMRMGGIKGERSREAVINLAASRGNLDDVYSHFIKSGLIHDEQTAKDFGFESWEKAKVMDDEGYKQFVMGYLGLEREKFDPTTVARRLAKEQGIDYDALNPYDENPEKAKQARETRSRLFNEASEITNKNADKADHEEQTALRTMYTISQSSRGVGHWEQTMATLDASTGKYRVMNEDERVGEVKGEARKRGSRAFMQGVAPHAMRALVYKEHRTNEEGKDIGAGWDFSTNPDHMSVSQRRFLSEVLTPSMIPEAHHFQARLSQILVGSHNGISDGNWQDRLFDENGNLIRTKEEDEQGKPTEDTQAYKRFKAVYEINPAMVRALWNSAYRGAKNPTAPIPLDISEDDRNKGSHYYQYRRLKDSKERELAPVDLERMEAPAADKLQKEIDEGHYKLPVKEEPTSARTVEQATADMQTDFEEKKPVEANEHNYVYDKGVWAKTRKKGGEPVEFLDDEQMKKVVDAEAERIKNLSAEIENAYKGLEVPEFDEIVPEDADSIGYINEIAEQLENLSGQFANLDKVIDPQSFTEMSSAMYRLISTMKENIDKMDESETKNRMSEAMKTIDFNFDMVSSGTSTDRMSQQIMTQALVQLVKLMKEAKADKFKSEEKPQDDAPASDTNAPSAPQSTATASPQAPTKPAPQPGRQQSGSKPSGTTPRRASSAPSASGEQVTPSAPETSTPKPEAQEADKTPETSTPKPETPETETPPTSGTTENNPAPENTPVENAPAPDTGTGSVPPPPAPETPPEPPAEPNPNPEPGPDNSGPESGDK